MSFNVFQLMAQPGHPLHNLDQTPRDWFSEGVLLLFQMMFPVTLRSRVTNEIESLAWVTNKMTTQHRWCGLQNLIYSRIYIVICEP